MECPHLANHRIIQQLPRKILLSCLVCGVENALWICVFCGHVGCSRYLKGHSLLHFQKSSHSISMEVETTAVYCYMCDEYVINTSESLEALRKTVNSYKTQIAKTSPLENGVVPPKMLKSSSVASGSRPSRQTATLANRLPGLKNLGNTCFMNAVVQSLKNIDFFSSYITKLPSVDGKSFVFRRRSSVAGSVVGSLSPSPGGGNSGVNGGADSKLTNLDMTPSSHPETRLRRKRDLSRLQPSSDLSSSPGDDNGLVIEQLRKVLVGLDDKSLRTISPDALFSAIWRVVPSFRGHQQQDAHEFMRFLLDRLHTELAQLHPLNRSKPYASVASALSSQAFGSSSPTDNSLFGRLTIVAAIFGGLLQSDVACHVCNNVSVKRDPFLDLSLDIPIPKEKLVTANSMTCRLVDCFSSFTDLEELSESEHFYCPLCRKRQPSTKKFTIKRLPNVLCVHLKRFWWNGTNRIKLDTFVDFPVRCLDMSKYVMTEQRCTRLSAANSDCHYDLAAVIVHHGSGTGSGHFTTFALNDGEWFHFNDSAVRPASLEDVQSAKAYILFYVRQNIRIPPALLAGDVGISQPTNGGKSDRPKPSHPRRSTGQRSNSSKSSSNETTPKMNGLDSSPHVTRKASKHRHSL